MKRTLVILSFTAWQSALGQVAFDTVSSRLIGPGITHTKMVAPAVPWIVNLLQIDLHNPYITLETVKALDRLTGLERTTSMASRKEAPGHAVVAAVNGDGYSGGIPANMQLVKGEPIRAGVDNPIVGINDQNDPMMNMADFNGEIRTASHIIHFYHINEARGGDDLVLYNHFFGTSTGTSSGGAEALLTPFTEWYANGLVRCVVDTIADGTGNMTVPASKVVFSATGAKRTELLANVERGDTVSIFLGIIPGPNHLKDLLGGFSILVSNGVRITQRVTPREPRTSAGFSADSSVFYLWTVDGRFPGSAGMTYFEMADFMLSHGMHFGINLDGGGSTTMVVRGGIMNRPSDGTERSVANAMLVVSSAPAGTLTSIALSPHRARVYARDSLQFMAYGNDQYGNPVALDPGSIQFSVDPAIGTISGTGMFHPADRRDSGYVRLSYQSFSDSAFVVIRTISTIALAPESVVTDTVRTVTFSVRAFDQDMIERQYDAGLLGYSVTDQALGSVTAGGVFSPTQAGTCGVIASYTGITDTAWVTIVVATGTIVIDSMESVSHWAPATLNVDTVLVSVLPGTGTLGPACIRVYYSYVCNSSSPAYVYLDTDLPVSGVPDTLLVDARADSARYRLFYILADENGELFRLYSTSYVDLPYAFKSIRASTANPIPLAGGSHFYYPVRLKRVEVQLLGTGRVSGNRYNGDILFDNLRAHYPAGVTHAQESFLPSGSPTLFQNYPNPFNPTTKIQFTIVNRQLTIVKVFDLLGKEVTTLVNEVKSPGTYSVDFDARLPGGQGSYLASGVYFYRIQAGDFVASKKLILLK